MHPGSWRAVWAYSAKRAVRDSRTLTLQETRARAVVAGEKAARTPRFVTTSKGTPTLDEASLARARALVGLKGYVTNIGADIMAPGEVISSYHDLWHVEQSFRMSKTDLRARPMFAHTRDAIEAHLTIVFAALARLPQQVDTRVRRCTWSGGVWGLFRRWGRVPTACEGVSGGVCAGQRGFRAVMRGGLVTWQVR